MLQALKALFLENFISGCLTRLLLFALIVTLAAWLLKGIRRVPIGARGVVFRMGRRTGEIRGEGITWIPAWISDLVVIYVRERQIDVPSAQYYTADRARLSFKTTVRVVVEDPAALLEQGPGTYEPFLRDGTTTSERGGEEQNLPVFRVMQDSVREAVRSLTIDEVMFGGPGDRVLSERIHEQLSRRLGRWGLGVRAVLMTDVDARDDDLRRAVQSEVRESLDGRGRLAAHRAEVAKGTTFAEVAEALVERLSLSGRTVSMEDAMRYLQASYQHERQLDIALRRAGSVHSLAHEWIVESGPGVLSGSPAPPVLGGDGRGGDGRPGLGAGGRHWILGREGEIQVDGEGVSRRHARIELRGDQLLITDLGSLNGTYVDGQKLTPDQVAAVTPASRIRFGKSITFTGDQLSRAVQR